MTSAPVPLNRADYLRVALFCIVLFGLPLAGDRPLTMHEAVLPENAREMYCDHDWLVPRYGGYPWLERPPLPQWLVVGVASLVGACNREWIVRLPGVVAALVGVMICLRLAAGRCGRTVGMMSALILATTAEYFRYASLAEADIYLAVLVTAALAVFAHIECSGEEPDEDTSVFGRRRGAVLLFFVLCGLTHLVKGLIFGPLMVFVPVTTFLLVQGSWSRVRRYLWAWGWIAFAALALAWPIAVYLRYPDVLELWKSDYLGRLDGGFMAEPWWYYLRILGPVLRPWLVPALLGIVATAPRVFVAKAAWERFLWCWALATPLFLSIPQGKHHHYLLPCLAPWAILASEGLVWLWQMLPHAPALLRNPSAQVVVLAIPGLYTLLRVQSKLAGPVWLPGLACAGGLTALGILCWQVHRRRAVLAATLVMVLVASGHLFVHGYCFHYHDPHRDDTRFIAAARAQVPQGEPIYVKRREGHVLDAFRLLFYLGDRSRLLPNLTYLFADDLARRDVYVVTAAGDRGRLAALGACELLLQSRHTLNERDCGERWALFRVRFRDGLPHLPWQPLSSMQATGRARGPFLVGPTMLETGCEDAP